MRLMIAQTLGRRGEQSLFVRTLFEEALRGVRDKDYLSDERLLLKDSWWGIRAAAGRAEPLQAERITGWML